MILQKTEIQVNRITQNLNFASKKLHMDKKKTRKDQRWNIVISRLIMILIDRIRRLVGFLVGECELGPRE